MPDSLRFEVLGPLRAWRGETRLDLGPVRQQAVLAALVLRPDVTVSHHELTDGLWERPPESNVLPVYVRRLRQCLDASGQRPRDSVIVSDRGGYRFASAGVRLDVARLEEMAAVAAAAEETGDLVTAVDTFADALRLFHGEPLTGLPGAFVQGERRRLEERRLLLLRRKLGAQLKLGRFDEVIGELSALVSADPPSEPLAALLMRALYGGGRQAEALKVFTDVRERLIDQLGVEPGEELRQVQESVLRGDDALLGTQRREAPRRARNELPATTGELVGRDRELALLVAEGDPESVSVDAIDGVPGAGKTTLAVCAAHRLRESCSGGALFVDLHGYTEGREPVTPERALRRLLRAVGVEDVAMPDDLDELSASWRAATARLELLLVLDNAESAGQVRPLLPAGPGSRVLVTSRRRLSGLDADRRVSLGALGLEAAERLLSRIVGAPRAEGERFAVRALAGLCGRLPLALRIAGARLQNRPMWTFKDLVDRMSDDERRLGELTAEDRSVEVALSLSYEQLRPAEKRAFGALGLSPTPEFDSLSVAALLDCSPAEAERQLENLVDASLVQEPASGRYRLHDLVAVYARRLAGELPDDVVEAARNRVYGLYLKAARRASEWGVARFPLEPGAGPFTGQRDASVWLDAVGDLPEVVTQAAEAGLDGVACSIAEGLVDYLARQQRYHECRAALQIALPLAERAEDELLVASLRFCLGYAYAMQGQLDRARGWFDDALRAGQACGDRGMEARALGGLTMVDLIAGRHDLALPGMRRVRAIADEVGDGWLAERSLSALGYLAYLRGEYEEALEHLGRARDLSEEIGSPGMLARVLCHSGTVRLEIGRFAEAALDLRRSVELAEETTDGLLTASSLARLGAAELELGNLDEAFELQRRALTAVTEETTAGMESEIRNRLGRTHLAAGDPVAAREHFEWVLTTMGPDGDALQRTLALEGLDLTRQSARRR